MKTIPGSEDHRFLTQLSYKLSRLGGNNKKEGNGDYGLSTMSYGIFDKVEQQIFEFNSLEYG